MKIVMFSAKEYEKKCFLKVFNESKYELEFVSERLTQASAQLARDADVVCCFVTDQVDEVVLQALKTRGVKLVALRSAGYDHVDLASATLLGIGVTYVPAYSPQAIAEFAVGLLLALTRKITLAYDRVRKYNFSLEGLAGINLYGRTVGVIGTGHIGLAFCKIMRGFGCEVLAFDPAPCEEAENIGVTYTSLAELYANADIISLHCLLNDDTRYMINADSLHRMKQGVIIINTGRGALLNTEAAIDALSCGKLGGLGLDVYEDEKPLFFQDLSKVGVTDRNFLSLLNFPNVVVTGHQAYLSEEALFSIARTTLHNIQSFEKGENENMLNALG